MPVIAQNQIIEVKFFCRAFFQTSVNVLHYTVTTTAGLSITDQQLATQLSTDAALRYKGWLPTVYNYSGARVQIIQPQPAPVYVVSTAGAGAGTVAGDPLPPAVSVLVSKRSNLAGRNNRGRAYLPFWSEAHCDPNGNLIQAGINAATAWANQFMAIMTIAVGGDSATLAPVVYNRKTGGAVYISNVRIPAQFATQRRRSQINKADPLGP